MNDIEPKKTRKSEIIFLTVVLSVLFLSLLILISALQQSNAPPLPTATTTLTATATSTITRTPTVTATLTNTITPTRTATITPTASTTSLPSQTPTAFVFDQGNFEMVHVFEQIIPGVINRFLIANDDSVWLASPYAVGRYQIKSRQFTQINLRDPVKVITRDGKAWILPPSGTPLTTWNGFVGDSFTEVNSWLPPRGYGLPSPLEPKISYDLADELWLTTAYDIRRLQGTQWRIFLPQEMGFSLPYRKTLSTSFVLSHSKVQEVSWAGSCDWSDGIKTGGDGLRIFKDGRWNRTELSVQSGCVSALLNDSSGNLWVAIEKQLWQFNEETEKWRQFTPPTLNATTYAGFTHGEIKKMMLAPDNSVWLIYELCGLAGCDTRQILYQIKNLNWTSVAESSDLEPPLYLFDQDSTLWAFSPGVINKLVEKTFRKQAMMNWIAADVDSDGNIWVLTGELNGQMILWKYPQ